MRVLIAVLTICIYSHVVQAQSQISLPESESTPAIIKPDGEKPNSGKAKTTSTTQDKAEAKPYQFAEKFKLHIFLNEVPGDRAGVIYKQVTKQINRPVTETRRVEGQEVRVTRYVSEQVTAHVESVSAGATIIDCDEIEVQVSTNEDGESQYNFEIQGKLLLRNGSSHIEAESAKCHAGKLTLTNVTAITSTAGGMTMKSSEVVIDLPVSNLRIGDEIPSSPPATPIPVYEDSDGFAPVPFTSSNTTPFAPNFKSDDTPATFPAEDLKPSSNAIPTF